MRRQVRRRGAKRILPLLAGALILAAHTGVAPAYAQDGVSEALDFIVLTIADDQPCGQVNGRRVYATNESTNRRIAITIEYQTFPANVAFRLFQGASRQYTEQFPKYFEHWLAPAERRLIGCSFVPRESPLPDQLESVEVLHRAVGAAFLPPEAEPQRETPASFFIAFVREEKNVAGCFYRYHVVNLHPARRIHADVESGGDNRMVALEPADSVPLSCGTSGFPRTELNEAEYASGDAFW